MGFIIVWFVMLVARLACVVVVVFLTLFASGVLFRLVRFVWRLWRRKTFAVPEWVNVNE